MAEFKLKVCQFAEEHGNREAGRVFEVDENLCESGENNSRNEKTCLKLNEPGGMDMRSGQKWRKI